MDQLSVSSYLARNRGARYQELADWFQVSKTTIGNWARAGAPLQVERILAYVQSLPEERSSEDPEWEIVLDEDGYYWVAESESLETLFPRLEPPATRQPEERERVRG